MPKRDQSATDKYRAAQAQLTDLMLVRQSAQSKVGTACVQAITVVCAVYVVTAVFNLFDVVHLHGMSGLATPRALSHALVLDALPVLVPQLRNVGPAIAGALGLAVLTILLAPLYIALHRRRTASSRLRQHVELLNWWAGEVPGVTLDDLANPEMLRQWVQRELDVDAPRRLDRLRQIGEWFRDDPLLMRWVSDLIGSRTIVRRMAIAAVLPAASVALARTLLLLASH